ncbi:MAG: NAD(P)H-hydrate epimerase [Tissierellia bacterium]|nr:NAD(P)H-hydrate epimerase [Tissierellia bacterium]
MISVDKDTMQQIDNYAIKVLEIPSIVLVEHAAMAVIKNLNLKQRQTFAIIVGVGNNGADGLAIARNLLSKGKDVDIYILSDIDKASEEFKIEYNIVSKLTDQIYNIKSISDMEFMDKNIDRVNTIIDGMFGTGLNREVKGVYSYVIDLINEKRIYKVSIDIPSGMDATTGKKLGYMVDSDLVVCMQLLKVGLTKNNLFQGKVVVEDISIPDKAIEKFV